MPESKRGPERRRSAAKAQDSGAHGQRREGLDRRRNGYVSQLELCRGLAYDAVESILERCPTESLAPGEVLLEPGQPNHHLYFLLDGRLEVRLQSIDSPVADLIEPGECIGEMSIIDGQPTSAYVVASEASTLIAVHANVFWSKIATSPQAVRNLSRVLAERMRKRNDATLRAIEKEIRLEQLQKELLAAREIQLGMLPPGPSLLAELPEIDVHARMDVMESVGGDFYDAFPLDGQRVCIALGDVSGKGMPAALFMVRTVTLLRSELVKSGELTQRINRFNKVLCETNISHMFVSLIVMVFDLSDGTVEYVNAGHLPMLLSSAGDPFTPLDDSQGLIAGVLEDNVYETSVLKLHPGDQIVLFTDGVTETRDAERHFYGMERLTDLLSDVDVTVPAAVVQKIFDDTFAFASGSPQADDVTIVAVRYLGS